MQNNHTLFIGCNEPWENYVTLNATHGLDIFRRVSASDHCDSFIRALKGKLSINSYMYDNLNVTAICDYLIRSFSRYLSNN